MGIYDAPSWKKCGDIFGLSRTMRQVQGWLLSRSCNRAIKFPMTILQCMIIAFYSRAIDYTDVVGCDPVLSVLQQTPRWSHGVARCELVKIAALNRPSVSPWVSQGVSARLSAAARLQSFLGPFFRFALPSRRLIKSLYLRASCRLLGSYSR